MTTHTFGTTNGQPLTTGQSKKTLSVHVQANDCKIHTWKALNVILVGSILLTVDLTLPHTPSVLPMVTPNHMSIKKKILPHFQYNTRDIYPKFHCYPCYY